MADAAGIDLSSFQPSFDWAAEKGRISFAFIKATEGRTIRDPDFAVNWREAGALGIVRGAYHFGHPKNGAATETRAFLAVVQAHGLKAGDLIALDLEASDGLSPARVSEYARNWCADVQRATGHTPIVYTFLSFAGQGNCAGLGHYPLWIAEPSAPAGRPVVPRPWSTWKFHQYGTARVGSNTVDVNVFNGDTAALKKFANPASSPKEETEVQSGSLNSGANAVTAIAIPFGSAKEIGFACDNGVQGLPSARLRVAVWAGHWKVHNPVVVDSSNGQTVIKFGEPSKTSVVSVERLDAGTVSVGYQVS
ncbi:MAG TPA: GH25 family lysozyme [Streptosporangiaceae bacterium]